MSAAVLEVDDDADARRQAEAYRLVARARSYGPLRSIDPEVPGQAAVVREAAHYDRSVLPRRQRAGDGFRELAPSEYYQLGVQWIPLTRPERAHDGRMYYYRRVASHRPHRPWVCRDHWLQVMLTTALDLRPETWRGVIARDEVIRIMTTATQHADTSGRACIVRVDELAKLLEVSTEKIRRAWRVVRELGLAVLLLPGRMLTEDERWQAYKGGSMQRGLANEWCFVTPQGTPAELLTTPYEPVRPPLRVLPGGKAAKTGTGTERHASSRRRGSRRSGLALAAVENRRPSTASSTDAARPVSEAVGTVTPPRRSTRNDQISKLRSAWDNANRSAGQKEPAPPAPAMTKRTAERCEPGSSGGQMGSQRAQERRGAAPSGARATSGRQHAAPGSGKRGRVYDPAAMRVAFDLIERLPWLTSVPAGRLENSLRRFAGAAMPWTAADLLAAIAAANRRNGRSELPIDGVRAPIAFLASLIRDLDPDADHPRYDLHADQLRPEPVSERTRENARLVAIAREARAAGRDLAEVLGIATDQARAAGLAACRAEAAAGARTGGWHLDEVAARRAAREAERRAARTLRTDLPQ